jgi:hypothetical protein
VALGLLVATRLPAQSIQLVNDLAGRGLYEVDVIVGIDVAISAHVRTPNGRNGSQLNVSRQARPDRNSLARRTRCNALAGNEFADMGALLWLKADTGSHGTCLNAHGLRQSGRCKAVSPSSAGTALSRR